MYHWSPFSSSRTLIQLILWVNICVFHQRHCMTKGMDLCKWCTIIIWAWQNMHRKSEIQEDLMPELSNYGSLRSIIMMIIPFLISANLLFALSAGLWWIKTSTHCLPQSGRWPHGSPSCLQGWSTPAGRGPNGKAAGPLAWSETCCDPQTGTLWRWRCSHCCPLLAWSSGSTGTRSRCDSGWGCSPVAPTEGQAVAAGYLLPSGHARHAWALNGVEEEDVIVVIS